MNLLACEMDNNNNEIKLNKNMECNHVGCKDNMTYIKLWLLDN